MSCTAGWQSSRAARNSLGRVRTSPGNCKAQGRSLHTCPCLHFPRQVLPQEKHGSKRTRPRPAEVPCTEARGVLPRTTRRARPRLLRTVLVSHDTATSVWTQHRPGQALSAEGAGQSCPGRSVTRKAAGHRPRLANSSASVSGTHLHFLSGLFWHILIVSSMKIMRI